MHFPHALAGRLPYRAPPQMRSARRGTLSRNMLRVMQAILPRWPARVQEQAQCRHALWLPCQILWLGLGLVCLLQGWVLWHTAPRNWPATIQLTLAKGSSQVMGQRELAAMQADRQHIRIARDADGAWFIEDLSPAKQVLLLKPDGSSQAIRGLGLQAMAGSQGLVLGHTALQLDWQGDHLRLQPVRRVSLFASQEVSLPGSMTWQWQTGYLWHLPWHASSAALLLCALCLLAPPWPLCRMLANGTLAMLALYALLNPVSPAFSVALATLAPLLWLHQQHRPSVGMGLAMLLLAVGMLSQLELGLAGMESIWLAYFQKSAALQALALGSAALFLHRPMRPPRLKRVEAILLALALLSLACMLLEVLFGSEAGVFGFQPVELAKLALVALSAHVLALFVHQSVNHSVNPPANPAANPSFPHRALMWRLLWPVVVLLALISLALVQVSDYSPLVLLLIWAGIAGLACCLAMQKRYAATGMLALILAAPLLIMGLHLGIIDIPPQFYAERFQVWLQPTLHPHTGQQFLEGAQAIASGGWLGADQVLGLATMGQAQPGLVHIPAVQDDFAAAFFIHRHGLAAALGLWLLQAGLLACLFYRAWRAWQVSQGRQDYRLAWQARFYSFVLTGGASFLFGQFLLSWGTNLGVLPVMGQPMSFLSAGGSHLLFFLLPLLTFYVLYAPSFEE